MSETDELDLIERNWKCPCKGGKFNVYGTIKALQYGISVSSMNYRYLRMNMPRCQSRHKVNPYNNTGLEP